MNDSTVDLLRRYAEAAERGAELAGASAETRAHHAGAAKAYRHAERLLSEAAEASALQSQMLDAVWRGTTNTDGISIDVSFDVEEYGVLRLRLPVDSAAKLADTVRGYLTAPQVPISSQSDKSEGSPSCDGSPTDGQNV